MYYALSDFVAFVGDGDVVITPKLLRAWVDDLKRRGKKGWTVFEWAKITRRWFRWLYDMEYIAENPWVNTRLNIKGSPMKTETFTPEEYEMIKARARGTIWYYAVVIGWNTGLRLVDVANLTWDDIDFSSQVIRMKPRKTIRLGTEVTIPFTSGSDISKMLYAMRNEPDESGLLSPALSAMTSKKFGSYKASVEFSLWLKARCKIQNKTFHTFRRSFITNIMSSGVSAEVAMSMCGITSRETLDHYYVPNIRALKDAILKWRDTTDL